MSKAELKGPILEKGPALEEKLRNYFLELHYFVLRGVKFKFNGIDVTDVDLWLYARTSPLFRERTNVDIKNKKTPQALERIFWTKGLQSVLRLDRCIVATTDSRPDVKEFGMRNHVEILDGRFLTRLQKTEKINVRRISEEQFLSEVDHVSLGKLGGDWKGRYEQAKSRTLGALNFDGCNAWLNDIRFFLEQAILSGSQTIIAWRLVYFCVALFLVGVDFIARNHVTLDAEQRKQVLTDGFRFGEAGRAYTENFSNLAVALVNSTSPTANAGEAIKFELERQSKQIPVELLGEFFARNSVQAALFEMAHVFEQAAFSTTPLIPSKLDTSEQSILGLLADFFGFDRKKVLA